MARVAVTISLSDDERAEFPGSTCSVSSSQDVAGALRGVRLGSSAAAEGLENKEIAVPCLRRARTPWASGVAARPLRRRASSGSVRRTPVPARRVKSAMSHSRRSGPADAGRTPPDSDPLEPSLDGAGERPRALDHSSHLAGLRLAAASLGDLQAVERSLLRGEGPRHRRSVFGAAGSCPGSLCRRKEPDPGLGPFGPSCRCAPGRRSGAATTTSATARPLGFAALDIATGEIIGKGFPRHRAREFRKFLDLVEANVPAISTIQSSWTTTARPTRLSRRSATGSPPRWQAHFDTQVAPPGSTRSSAGSGC